MSTRITTDHVYHVGTDTVIAIDENLLVCIDGTYYTVGIDMRSEEGYCILLHRVNADGKVDPQALVDANVAVEE